MWNFYGCRIPSKSEWCGFYNFKIAAVLKSSFLAAFVKKVLRILILM